mmetsp:Transcript_7061/g.12662  ORF Transcript_7061/g.12662 Transcript_7061/m.12662 type:complete len:405 (-) Transcript_7061:2924-4138(-)|eukprot:CAMPEP_0182444080 /NCGR_PEP_ID=MMETSP1172-20130603/2640_1 /TAXON_ID=708627 /ORGANISM="Timspurckia oligopyrenoides, Strain CCMP3278" /LENGTH=404 /DNA_ID=CAMNT_0024639549 /DNA_START=38 /DNA_END=1252 /DNA_ORIENTATION=+
MSNYEVSTQRHSWTLTIEELRELRSNGHSLSLDRIQSSQKKSLHSDAYSTTTPGGNGMIVDDHIDSNFQQESIHPLTLSEEEILRRFHEQRISRICRRLHLSTQLIATAVVFFKRFFMSRSVMEFNPAVISLSSIYAALKVEEVNLSAHDLIKFIDGQADVFCIDVVGHVKAESLLENELDFLQKLKFHLICFHPYHSLIAAEEQLSLYMKSALNHDEEKVLNEVKKMTRDARDVLNSRVLFSDLILTTSPGLLALAALAFCSRKYAKEDQVYAMIRSLFKQVKKSVNYEEEDEEDKGVKVVEKLAAVINGLSDSKPDVEEVRKLELRRQLCSNAENDPESEVFEAKLEKKRMELDMKRQEKYKQRAEKLRREQAQLTGIFTTDLSSESNPNAMDISVKKQKIQ